MALGLPLLTPVPLTRVREPFDDPDWLFEIKHDGFRALAFVEPGRARLVSRNGNTFKRFAPLAEELVRSVRSDAAVLDGELACLDGDGRSQFNALLRGAERLPRRVRPLVDRWHLSGGWRGRRFGEYGRRGDPLDRGH